MGRRVRSTRSNSRLDRSIPRQPDYNPSRSHQTVNVHTSTHRRVSVRTKTIDIKESKS